MSGSNPIAHNGHSDLDHATAVAIATAESSVNAPFEEMAGILDVVANRGPQHSQYNAPNGSITAIVNAPRQFDPVAGRGSSHAANIFQTTLDHILDPAGVALPSNLAPKVDMAKEAVVSVFGTGESRGITRGATFFSNQTLLSDARTAEHRGYGLQDAVQFGQTSFYGPQMGPDPQSIPLPQPAPHNLAPAANPQPLPAANQNPTTAQNMGIQPQVGFAGRMSELEAAALNQSLLPPNVNPMAPVGTGAVTPAAPANEFSSIAEALASLHPAQPEAEYSSAQPQAPSAPAGSNTGNLFDGTPMSPNPSGFSTSIDFSTPSAPGFSASSGAQQQQQDPVFSASPMSDNPQVGFSSNMDFSDPIGPSPTGFSSPGASSPSPSSTSNDPMFSSSPMSRSPQVGFSSNMDFSDPIGPSPSSFSSPSSSSVSSASSSSQQSSSAPSQAPSAPAAPAPTMSNAPPAPPSRPSDDEFSRTGGATRSAPVSNFTSYGQDRTSAVHGGRVSRSTPAPAPAPEPAARTPDFSSYGQDRTSAVHSGRASRQAAAGVPTPPSRSAPANVPLPPARPSGIGRPQTRLGTVNPVAPPAAQRQAPRAAPPAPAARSAPPDGIYGPGSTDRTGGRNSDLSYGTGREIGIGGAFVADLGAVFGGPGRTGNRMNESTTSAGDRGGDGSGGGGSTILCGHYYSRGLLATHIYRADLVYAARHVDVRILNGYHTWAVPLRAHLRRHPRGVAERAIRPIVVRVAEHMAYKIGVSRTTTLTGAAFFTAFYAVSWVIGGIVSPRKNPAL